MKYRTRLSAALSLLFILSVVSVSLAETRYATFDNIVTGMNLNGYTEGNLIISTPQYAYVAYYSESYFPSIFPSHPGFSGGFFYPSGGVYAPITIRAADGATLYDIKFNAGSGWTDDPMVNLVWEMYDNGVELPPSNRTRL